MNQISNTYRLIALSMALLMFATTLSFSIDMHYCNGELQSISLFGIAESCQVQQEAEHASKDHATHQHKHEHKKDCSNEKRTVAKTKPFMWKLTLMTRFSLKILFRMRSYSNLSLFM